MVKRAPPRSRVAPDRRPPSDFSLIEAAEVAPPASDEPSAELDIEDLDIDDLARSLGYMPAGTEDRFHHRLFQQYAAGPAAKEAVIAGIRRLSIYKRGVWKQVQADYPGARLFVIGIAPEAVVLHDEQNHFEARAELLLQVPAVSASRQSVMAPLTLPLDIEGSILGLGGPVIESVTLADTGR